jgi:hypothetical protein
LPFFVWSVHVGVSHRPPTHRALAQSLALAQPSPGRHAGQVPPPQSMAVSTPFLTKSAQVPAWQVPLQTWLVQSPGALQACPVAQRAGHAAPPQSIPVSS